MEDEARGERAAQTLAGLRFVVTGRLERFSRSEIQDLIKELGGAVSGSVSSKTDYLVAGQDAGSKLVEAEGFGTKILTEDELVELTKEDQRRNLLAE